MLGGFDVAVRGRTWRRATAGSGIPARDRTLSGLVQFAQVTQRVGQLYP